MTIGVQSSEGKVRHPYAILASALGGIPLGDHMDLRDVLEQMEVLS
jgi:hypothetical protein